jgi:hypothetical protein
MYVTFSAKDRNELWVSDIDGNNKIKIATSLSLATGVWAPDNSHISFVESEPGKPDRGYVVGADGSGLRQIPWAGGTLFITLWSPDQKTLYLSGYEKGSTVATVWKENAEGANPEKLAEDCGFAFDVAPGGQYTLNVTGSGAKVGIYELSVSDKKCTSLLPGVVTFGISSALDGKAFLYAVPSRHDVTIYRQPWQDGKLIGQPQVALKLPFAFPLVSSGNAYDFARDLSVVAYARPGGHADLFLLSQK